MRRLPLGGQPRSLRRFLMHRRQGGRVGVIQTGRMPKAPGADAGPPFGVRRDVKNNVIGSFRIT